jgi:hypothetical protein
VAYEIQSVTDIEQFSTNRNRMFPGKILFINAPSNTFTMYFSDAPRQFIRVRAWDNAQPSDWATIYETSQ